jgi:hypothetical protein
MKRIIALTLFNLFVINGFASTEIAKVVEKNSTRSLIYSQEGNQLVFTLANGTLVNEIKRLTFDATSTSLRIEGDNDVYNFDFFKSMTRASGKAYKWCWAQDLELVPAMYGLPFFLVGAIPTMSLCAVGPGVPFILGVIAAPIDGVISLGDRIFDADTIAARKFSALLRGNNKKASPKVFSSLVRQISKL